MSGTKVIPPADQPKCPQCGTPLPTGALAGLCPACLLKMGAAADTVTEGKQPPFTPPPVAELAPLFPQLEILELIGKGGMGAVYKARQKQLDRIVALKILPPGIGNDSAFAERFTREARALAKLNHPGIVTLYEFGVAPTAISQTPDPRPQTRLYFFLMEFVDGVNLRQLLHAGRVSAREALAIVPQICDALQFAHDQGIVHRDIKPENILLDRRGRVKVADFGLAKIVGADAPLTPSLSPSDGERVAKPGEGTPVLTDAGKVMGTPQYMSPEQIQAPGEVDHRADIYALGVVFYQMLTGELPGKPLVPPSSRTRGIQLDVRLDEIVLRALEKNPELRYQQVSEVKTCVETIAASSPGSSRREEAQSEAKGGRPKLTSLPTNRPGRVVYATWGLWTFALVFLVIFKKVGSPAWNFWVSLLPLLPVIFLVDVFLRFRKESQSNTSSRRREETQTAPENPKQDWGTWLPLQSPEGAAICSHLTKAERNHASLLGLLFGVWMAGTMFGVPFLIRSFPAPGNWIVASVWAALFIVSLPMLQRMVRHFLCSTVWARQQNFTPEKLRLFSFHGGNLWKGGAVLVVGLLFIFAQNKTVTSYLGIKPTEFQALSVPEKGPAVAPSGQAAFDPVIEPWLERTLPMSELGYSYSLNLESDLLQPMPANLTQADWNSGITLPDGVIIVAAGSGKAVSVAGTSTQVEPLRVGMVAWENLTTADIKLPYELEQGQTAIVSGESNSLPLTFAFRTHTGTSGLLQITGFTENPRGVKIRYKLGRNETADMPSVPPVVVKTIPESGAAEVDPGLTELRVTFSKPMRTGGWSWVKARNETFPEVTGETRFLPDGQTCVLPVKLQPGKLYIIWLNRESAHNFQDVQKQAALPYLLIFQTRK